MNSGKVLVTKGSYTVRDDSEGAEDTRQNFRMYRCGTCAKAQVGVKVGGRVAATYSIDLFQSSAALFSDPELESAWIDHMAVLGGSCIGILCSQILQNLLVLISNKEDVTSAQN